MKVEMGSKPGEECAACNTQMNVGAKSCERDPGVDFIGFFGDYTDSLERRETATELDCIESFCEHGIEGDIK